MSMERIIPEPVPLKFQIYGESVSLHEPTVDQIIELQKSETADTATKMTSMKLLAVSLGMPDKLAGRMRLSDFTAIFAELTGADKKK